MKRLRLRAPAADDSGVSAIEWAMLTPILLLIIGLVIQAALIYQAREAALAAAQAAARTARTYNQPGGNWQDAAVKDGKNALRAYGGNDLASTGNVTTSIGGIGNADSSRWVTVHVRVPSLLPISGASFDLSETSGGPRECFRPDVGTGQDEGVNCG